MLWALPAEDAHDTRGPDSAVGAARKQRTAAFFSCDPQTEGAQALRRKGGSSHRYFAVTLTTFTSLN
jgi:hypothetical protein